MLSIKLKVSTYVDFLILYYYGDSQFMKVLLKSDSPETKDLWPSILLFRNEFLAVAGK